MANDEADGALFDDLTGSNTASRPPQRSQPCERHCVNPGPAVHAGKPDGRCQHAAKAEVLWMWP